MARVRRRGVGPSALGATAWPRRAGGGVCSGGDERVGAGGAEAAAVGEPDDAAAAAPAAQMAESGAAGVPPSRTQDRQVRKADDAEIDQRVEQEAVPHHALRK
ncbi:MAG: hypothetical protein C0475_08145 [Planctomyces sp.]|nr:hypothetical protein [Planctomyces sp.]